MPDPEPTQTLIRADGFETLHVESGYWSTKGWVGEFDSVTIDAGAALRANQANFVDGAWSPIHTNQVVTNGLLVFNIDDAEAFDDADDLVISGTGTVRLEGEVLLHVAKGNIRHIGTTKIANGGMTVKQHGDTEFAGVISAEVSSQFLAVHGGLALGAHPHRRLCRKRRQLGSARPEAGRKP